MYACSWGSGQPASAPLAPHPATALRAPLPLGSIGKREKMDHKSSSNLHLYCPERWQIFSRRIYPLLSQLAHYLTLTSPFPPPTFYSSLFLSFFPLLLHLFLPPSLSPFISSFFSLFLLSFTFYFYGFEPWKVLKTNQKPFLKSMIFWLDYFFPPLSLFPPCMFYNIWWR